MVQTTHLQPKQTHNYLLWFEQNEIFVSSSGCECLIHAVLHLSVITFPVSTQSRCRNTPMSETCLSGPFRLVLISAHATKMTTFAFIVQLTVCHTRHPAFTGMLLINLCVLKGLLDHLCHFFCFVLFFVIKTIILYHIKSLRIFMVL